MLRSLARLAPVVIAVDDVQWLDRPSARALSFALRRLHDEPVLVLGSRRSSLSTPLELEEVLPHERVTTIAVERLQPDDMRRLVGRDHLGHDVTPATLRRVVAAADGNPMVALELGRAIRDRRIVPVAGEPLPLPDRLGELVRERLAALPAASQAVLAEAAALAHPTIELVAGSSRAKRRALATAADAGVVELDRARVRFLHPLYASALYGQLSPSERAALHRRLAARVSDPEERARHVAVAASEPDETAAAAIVDGAELAARRGAPDDAADLYERAVALTPPERADDARARSVRAAELALTAGDPARARTLVESAHATARAWSERARALQVLASAIGAGQDIRTTRELVEQALADAADDLRLRVQIERQLANAFIHWGDLKRGAHHAHATIALARDVNETELALSLALAARIDFMLGRGLRRDDFERALGLYDVRDCGPDAHPALWAGPTLQEAGELAAARSIMEQVRQTLEDWGSERRLPFVAGILAAIEMEAGEYERAAQLADDAAAMARTTHQPSLAAMALELTADVAAHRGDVARVMTATREARALAETAGSNTSGGDGSAKVLGFLELSRGRPRDALAHLVPVHDQISAYGIGEASYFMFLQNEIEALVAAGELERALARLEPWERRARATSRPHVLAAAARCRGLLDAAAARTPEALESFDDALDHHSRAERPLERARTLLVRGEVERRAKQRRAARASLGEALAEFERLSAVLWAAKARKELERVGGRAPARSAGLTATEERVAELVAAGATNREVADTLFVSVKTVEANLSRIYRKLRRPVANRARRAPSEPAERQGRGAQTVGISPISQRGRAA